MIDAPIVCDLFRWNTLQQGIQEQKIKRAFEIFRENKVEPLIFKGWAVAKYYPVDNPRAMGDIDLAVASDIYPAALQLLQRDDVRQLNIDLHREFRHLDTVAWSDIFSNSDVIEVDGTAVRVPRAEDHLRLICVHWLTDGGASHDRLWDIHYLILNRRADFDWSRCLEVVSPRRRRWIICAIGLAHRYVGLELDGLPFRDEAAKVPNWVIKCVEKEWERGGNIEPILASTYDRSVLIDQLKRRFPPNPLRAVIEAEGSIDRSIRFDYQIRVLFRRAFPFLKDTGEYLIRRIKKYWGNRHKE